MRPGPRHLAVFATLLLAVSAWAAPPPGLLPQSFSGWQKVSGGQSGMDAAVADPAYASLLQEFGFTDFESATYILGERTLRIKAARFGDASGAYGAFTFYREARMAPEKICDVGASAGLHVLLLCANVVVDVSLDKVTAMTAASLREFAGMLPLPARRDAILPSLPLYLPEDGYIKNSQRYIEGPVALAQADAPLPADLVDFTRKAEVVTGKYSTSSGLATLTVISYPTPQIAGERLRAIAAFGASPANTAGPTFQARRSGPIVAVVTGQASRGETRSLLEAVNFDADITWNEPTYLGKKDNVGNLLVNIIYLIAVIFLFMLVAGVAFGGVRLVAKRLYPERVFDRPEEMEIIRLNLR